MARDLTLLYDTIIVDIGNVLFTWSSKDLNMAIGSKLFRRMVNSQIWGNHETGKFSDDEAYASLAKEFKVNEEDVRVAMTSAIETLSARAEMFELIRSLKPGRKIYAMSNMSASSWSIVKGAGEKHWDVFDDVFISGDVGHRKPELAFYHHVLQKTGAKPTRTIFVDDTVENLATAHTFGIRTILYDNLLNVERVLRNLCGDPVTRANTFLAQNAKKHLSYTSTGHIVHENFCQLMILEATQDPSLVDYLVYEAEWDFFQKFSGQFTDAEFPADLDTTSMAWSVIPDVTTDAIKNKVMDRMVLEYLDNDGIPFTYFDRNRARRDHGVCVNVLTLFYTFGRGHELSKAVDFVHSLLESGAYSEGSRYYRAPETFLYFVSRLLEASSALEDRMGNHYEICCRHRIGFPADALALAMRLHCCTRINLNASIDFRRLLDIQQLDGGWEGGSFYTYGLVNLTVANRGLTTAIAQRAITEYISKFEFPTR